MKALNLDLGLSTCAEVGLSASWDWWQSLEQETTQPIPFTFIALLGAVHQVRHTIFGQFW